MTKRIEVEEIWTSVTRDHCALSALLFRKLYPAHCVLEFFVSALADVEANGRHPTTISNTFQQDSDILNKVHRLVQLFFTNFSIPLYGMPKRYRDIVSSTVATVYFSPPERPFFPTFALGHAFFVYLKPYMAEKTHVLDGFALFLLKSFFARSTKGGISEEQWSTMEQFVQSAPLEYFERLQKDHVAPPAAATMLLQSQCPLIQTNAKRMPPWSKGVCKRQWLSSTWTCEPSGYGFLFNRNGEEELVMTLNLGCIISISERRVWSDEEQSWFWSFYPLLTRYQALSSHRVFEKAQFSLWDELFWNMLLENVSTTMQTKSEDEAKQELVLLKKIAKQLTSLNDINNIPNCDIVFVEAQKLYCLTTPRWIPFLPFLNLARHGCCAKKKQTLERLKRPFVSPCKESI